MNKSVPLKYHANMSYIKERIKPSEENVVINPPNRSKPMYRAYKDEDGSRVSEVQNVELLDLSKHIIQIPRATNDVTPKEQNTAYNHAIASKYANQYNK